MQLARLAPLALLFAGVASAQTTGTITGVVTDGSNGQPVVGALVTATSPAAPGEQTVVTDAKGSFTIANLPAGRYKLAASADGYKSELRADLALGENVTLRANLAVVPEAVQMEEVVVTGSRIRRKDLTTPAPVSIMTREAVVASGKVSIGDFLQSMPEQGNAINTQYNNSGNGTTTISLRSLGAGRTLVLVNGRRFVPGGDGADSTVDLNSIPTSAIERIEVLKDGASAVYGSDAVAGVVNIILRKRFNGTEVTAFAGTSGHNDGQIYDVNFTTGTGTEKGNILFSGGYYEQKTVWAGDRDFAATALTLDYASGETIPGGSSAVPNGRFRVDPDACTTQACIDLAAATPGTGAANFIVVPGAGGADPTFRPYVAATDAYNFQPENYLVTPQKRVSLFATGDTNLGNVARGYFEASYVNRKSSQKLAPEPLFTVNFGVPISADSFYNPFGVDIPDARRRLVEFGNRDFTQDITTFRVVTGLDGSFGDWAGPLSGWTWDASYNFGRTQGVNTTNGTLRVPRIAAAIGPSMIDPATGAPVCVQTAGDLNTQITGCTPLNMLGGVGSITQEQVLGLGFFGTDLGLTQQEIVQVGVSGELFKLFSDRAAGLALGFDWRNERGFDKPNPITGSGENSGNNYFATEGGYEVTEGYGELSIPLINNVPFAQDLELTAAARIFNYSTFGSDNTYKFGLTWQPVSDVTLRGTYSTAFRAPTISALFSGQADNFAQVSDPCGGGLALPNPADPNDPILTNPNSTYNRCLADGAIAPNTTNGDDRDQLRSTTGGNPDLTPETAKIFTVGAVFLPRWVPNLSLTVDYYSIDLTNSISSIGEGTIISNCYPLPTEERKYCGKITRDPGTGLITNIANLNENIGGTKTAGLDVSLKYTLPTDVAGQFRFGVDGTYLQYYDDTLADGTVIKNAGTYDQSLAMPRYKANASVLWSMSDLGAGLSGRYIGTFKECADPDGLSGAGGLCYVDATLSRQVETYMTFDGYVTYGFSSVAGKTAVTVGAQNLLDRKPAKVYNGFLASSDASTYDYMGRYVYARLSQSF
ncbi:MAG: TonB-dependent receptor [Anaeromyxobacter sp.]|nr:TonB-dependent receptor [Anaeromyxobacter sp.]